VSLPAITSDQIFVVTRSDGGSQIRALAQSDGRELWRHEQTGLLNAAPVVVDGRLYLRGNAGAVLVFAPS
ncbi:MAG TPA: PQQ-binding-like beta-propeller repeat protein, partial [Caldilineaceae bacterium]|nr:PQQ-binding-like beta-propeller repeat protein [Caldilineaceae bacterium]